MSVEEAEEGDLRVEMQDPLTGSGVHVFQRGLEIAHREQSMRPALLQARTEQQVAS